MASTVARIYDVDYPTVVTGCDSFADALSEGYLSNFTSFMPSLFDEGFVTDLRDAVADYRAILFGDLYEKKQAKETLDVFMVRNEVSFELRPL